MDTMHISVKEADQIIRVQDFNVPDLWHIAMEFRDAGNIPAYEAILNTWHFAHVAKQSIDGGQGI